MIDSELKQIIKLIALKYELNISYINNEITLFNNKHKLNIQQKKNQFLLKYNSSKGIVEIKIFIQDLWDVIISIITRHDSEVINVKNGFLLTLEEYFKEEGISAQKDWNKFVNEMKTKKIKKRTLFGNRIEVDYFQGYLFIFDSMFFEKTNIILFKE